MTHINHVCRVDVNSFVSGLGARGPALLPQAVREGLQAKLGDTVAPTVCCQATQDAADVDHPAPGLL